MPDVETASSQWSVDGLRERLEREERFFVFDVRNTEDFESWKIEGRVELPTVNVPYYEMLEEGEQDDIVDTFTDFFKRRWTENLPKDTPILTVCAKGDTSAYVADALRRLGFQAVNLEGGAAAWGDHYHARPVLESEELAIYQLSRPARGCLSYLVASRGRAAVIDPLRHVDTYTDLTREKNLEIELVIDTHGHADHISGGPDLAASLEVPYYLHPYDAIHPIDVMPATIDYLRLEDGQALTVGSASMRAIHIPGHTLGSVAFLLDDRFLFSGDSIFIESIARPDLGGRADTWAPLHHASLRKLLELPEETLVLPGHFASLAEAGDDGLFAATLGVLRQDNEGLIMAQRSQEDFVGYILSSLPEFPEEYIEIKRVNAGLAQVEEARASELELGKNLCALA